MALRRFTEPYSPFERGRRGQCLALYCMFRDWTRIHKLLRAAGITGRLRTGMGNRLTAARMEHIMNMN